MPSPIFFSFLFQRFPFILTFLVKLKSHASKKKKRKNEIKSKIWNFIEKFWLIFNPSRRFIITVNLFLDVGKIIKFKFFVLL